jgi:hypothetical protein
MDYSGTGNNPEANANGDPPEDLSEIMDFSIYDLRTTIRLIVLSAEPRRIDVKRGSLSGTIFIKEGEICRAETNERDGDEAFFEILSWENAVHSDTTHAELPEANVRIPTAVLLDLLKSAK